MIKALPSSDAMDAQPGIPANRFAHEIVAF